MKLKIAVVVHGRFYSFDLVRALLQRGHHVTLFTNYPRWVVKRFDVPGDCVRSFWEHGALTRAALKLHQHNILRYREEWFHPMFGRWACTQLQKEDWDIVYSWSGVSEEIVRAFAGRRTLNFVMRSSAHIQVQARLLEEEERRTGAPQECPSPWIRAREEREYALADGIVVISTFSYNTFVTEGVPSARLLLMLPGTRLSTFRPAPDIVEARCARILSGEPLRVLSIGTFSFRKGMWDMAVVIRELDERRFRFCFVGPIAPEALALANTLRSSATFISKQPEAELPAFYARGDIFMLPTIEDGFQSVLGQAAASALPILTTPNGAGQDIVREGETGWVLPIRSPEMFIERLRWCDEHRKELAAIVQHTYRSFRPRDWTDMAVDFETLCLACLGQGQ